MTIYEKIKTLSINDMAEFLTEHTFGCEQCEEHERLSDNPLLKEERCDEQCKRHCLKWLNEEPYETEKCPYYFIDDCGQGFTAACCSLGEDPHKVTALFSGLKYETFVGCRGDKSLCETGIYKN